MNPYEMKQLWESDVEFYLTNNLYINKEKADQLIRYLKENYSIIKNIKDNNNNEPDLRSFVVQVPVEGSKV